MQRYYLNVKQFIEHDERYAALRGKIYGSNYPPSYKAVIIAQITQVIWLAGIVGLMFGETIINSLGIQEPAWFKEMNKNKVATFAFLFIINTFGNSQLATGAFEIYYNEQLIYSKLSTGKLPNGEDLVNALALAGFR